MKVFNKKIASLVLTTLVFGCATTHSAEDSIASTDQAVATANKKLDSTQSIANNNFNYDMDSIYISSTSIKRKDTDLLPPKFSEPTQIDASFTSMNEVGNTLNKLSGYPVLINVDPKQSNSMFYLRLTQQNGNLTDLLNNLCAKTNTAWKFINGKLVITDLQVETFFIKALPGDIQVQNQVNSNNGIQSQSGGTQTAGQAGSSGGGSGGAQSQVSGNLNTVQNIQFNLNNSIWDNISNTVTKMKSSRGEVQISPGSSSITIIDKPANVLEVGAFIAQQNEMLKKQVQIDVQVYSVETDATDNYMLNWNAMLNGTNAAFNINGQAAGGASTGTGIVPVMTPSGTTQSFTLSAKTGDLSGSQIVGNALSQTKKSSLVTSAAATTLNNQPVPIQVVEQQGYISNVSTTQVAQAGTQQSVTTGQISYGFTLNILPTIENNGLIDLQISLNLSSLKSLDSYAVTGASVQLPNIIQRNTMQKVTLRNGDTYVSTGFDSDFNSITNTGVGSSSFWLLGGGVSSQKTRQKLVMVISPRIVKM